MVIMAPARILVVDDNDIVRENVRQVLERGGFQVLSAESGHEAIDLMAQGDNAATVCALLCDLTMPDGRGSEVIVHFHQRYPLIPIVVFSGAEASEYVDAISHPGVSDWLRKPATRDAILEKIRGAVNLHALRKRDFQPS
jgi:two-component system, CAI-1 autoinducer sensor kinase/phosphatase CqsS